MNGDAYDRRSRTGAGFWRHWRIHKHVPGRATILWIFVLLSISVFLHAVSLKSDSAYLRAIGGRTFFVPILFAAIEGGLVSGVATALLSGAVLFLGMVFDSSAHFGDQSTASAEHAIEIVVFVSTAFLAGFFVDHVVHERMDAFKNREMFTRYVSPAVVQRILSEGAELRGEETTATVLFADIRGFTTMCEHREPGEILRLLNCFFAETGRILLEHDAMIDKYIGDAVMAVFGVPLRAVNHARQAVSAARAMTSRLTQLNVENAFGVPLAMGIGIHTGIVIAGSVGFAQKMDYTVLGDTVNVAARLQSLTRDFGCPTIVSQSTVDSAGYDESVRALGETNVKGRAGSVRIYSV